jgi:hypothetical protein
LFLKNEVAWHLYMIKLTKVGPIIKSMYMN